MGAQNTPRPPELPPFPPTQLTDNSDRHWPCYGYTADQLRAYATPIAAERDRLREEVAGVREQEAHIAGCLLDKTQECTRLRTLNTELVQALSAMMTHMGMDEDEWNKPTFDQARAALAKAGP